MDGVGGEMMNVRGKKGKGNRAELFPPSLGLKPSSWTKASTLISSRGKIYWVEDEFAFN